MSGDTFIRNKAFHEEFPLVHQVLHTIPDVTKENYQLAVFISSLCLRSCNYEIEQAVVKVRMYFDWRKKTYGDYADQTIDFPLQEHIDTNCFVLLPGRTNTGELIIYYRSRLHAAWRYSAQALFKLLHCLIIMSCKAECELLTSSYVIITDYDQAHIFNYDFNINHGMQEMLTSMPIKISTIIMYRSGFWRKSVFLFLGRKDLLMPNIKFAENYEDLLKVLDIQKNLVPVCLGGQLECDFNIIIRDFVKFNVQF